MASNSIILWTSAGFDKSCEVPKALEHVGFGAIELGGITLNLNQVIKPRMYRLVEDNALINRMGFNNIGMNKALSNIRRHAYTIPVGINVGVNKNTSYEDRYQDYIKVIDTFKNDVTFFTVNISSQILRIYRISMTKMNFQCFVKL